MSKNKGIILGICLSISLVIFDMIFVGGVSVLRYIMYDTNIITYDETNIICIL